MFQIAQVKKHERGVSMRWMKMMVMKEREKEKDENALEGELKINLLHLRNIPG